MIDGTPEFFAVTKRIHNRLHGAAGDGGALDETARRVYQEVLAANVDAFAGRVREGDVVILHDPQTAGMATALREAGAATIWRCHVGLDAPTRLPARRGRSCGPTSWRPTPTSSRARPSSGRASTTIASP